MVRGAETSNQDCNDILSALHGIALFADLPPDQLGELAQHSRVVEVVRDDWLFREGDASESMFVVVSGRLESFAPGAGNSKGVALTRGAVVGELSLLVREPRSSSVRAVHDSELLEIGREEFVRVLWRNPAAAVLFSTLLSQRLRDLPSATKLGADQVQILALVSLDDAAPLAELANALIAAIQPRTVGLMYESERAPARLTTRQALSEYGTALRQETIANELVLLLDDRRGTNPAWSAFTLQRAQAVVAIATHRTEVSPAQAGDLRGCHLVFLSEPGHCERLETWLDTVHPTAHHFIPAGVDDGTAIARAARRVMGRSPGLVLSGGGAAGLAHIGVLQAFGDAGIRFDRVGGCSIGAFIGALYAMGIEPDDMVEVCRAELVRRKPFSDYTIPRHALIKGRRGEAMLKRVFGDARIERLALDYFCVSADLLSADLVVHRRGELWEAVGMSMSVPGLAPPHRWNGRLLVDGGILDNLPIDVMAEQGEGPVVAVDVIGRRVAHAVNPDGKRRGNALPRIGDTLIQSMILGSHHRIALTRSLADLVVAPDVAGVSLLEFERIDEAVASGRAAAERALEENPAVLAAAAQV